MSGSVWADDYLLGNFLRKTEGHDGIKRLLSLSGKDKVENIRIVLHLQNSDNNGEKMLKS